MLSQSVCLSVTFLVSTKVAELFPPASASAIKLLFSQQNLAEISFKISLYSGAKYSLVNKSHSLHRLHCITGIVRRVEVVDNFELST